MWTDARRGVTGAHSDDPRPSTNASADRQIGYVQGVRGGNVVCLLHALEPRLSHHEVVLVDQVAPAARRGGQLSGLVEVALLARGEAMREQAGDLRRGAVQEVQPAVRVG